MQGDNSSTETGNALASIGGLAEPYYNGINTALLVGALVLAVGGFVAARRFQKLLWTSAVLAFLLFVAFSILAPLVQADTR